MLCKRKAMNPFTIPLIAIPVAITFYASFVKGRWARLGLLLVATKVFWLFLQAHVDWTFTNPFEPNDGGPRTVAFLLGWLYGLVLVIAPVFWSSKGIQWIWSKIRN